MNNKKGSEKYGRFEKVLLKTSKIRTTVAQGSTSGIKAVS